MIDEKYITTAFLAGMEWERSKNKLPIREAIAVCVRSIKDQAVEYMLAPDGAYICGKCGLISCTTKCKNCGHVYQRLVGKA